MGGGVAVLGLGGCGRHPVVQVLGVSERKKVITSNKTVSFRKGRKQLGLLPYLAESEDSRSVPACSASSPAISLLEGAIASIVLPEVTILFFLLLPHVARSAEWNVRLVYQKKNNCDDHTSTTRLLRKVVKMNI